MYKFTIIILLPVILSAFSVRLKAQNTDIDLLRSINNISETVDASKFISNTTTITSLGVPVVMTALALLQQDDKLLKDAIYVGASLAVNGVITYGIKNTVRRQRPYMTYNEIVNRNPLDPTDPELSFPSGHTSLAFSTATALSLKYPKWYVIAPSFLWASSVGYSRMNLGVHYPSDVLAGAVLGAGSAYVTFLINEWFWKKHENKKLIGLKSYL